MQMPYNKRSIKRDKYTSLLFFLLVTALFPLSSGSSTLPLDTTRASSTVRRSEGKVDVFLRVQTNDEGWDVDDLLADAIIYVSKL
jgi:hypothetical protein